MADTFFGDYFASLSTCSLFDEASAFSSSSFKEKPDISIKTSVINVALANVAIC